MQFDYINKYGKTSIEYKILDTGCFECIGRLSPKGYYPQITINRKHYNVHRFIFIMEKNNGVDLDKSIVIRHICDNRLCINPNHLISGTQSDNMYDRLSRKRGGGNIKLSENQVKLIRLYYELGRNSQSELAKMFCVRQTTISEIVNGNKWKDLK